jgi:hypothetical protein
LTKKKDAVDGENVPTTKRRVPTKTQGESLANMLHHQLVTRGRIIENVGPDESSASVIHGDGSGRTEIDAPMWDAFKDNGWVSETAPGDFVVSPDGIKMVRAYREGTTPE